jgi:four helix bundle protein
MKKSYDRNPIVEKSFDFAINIVAFCHQLEQERKYAIAKQLIRSGTSVGANINEAQSPESRKDFVHKLKISAKEANETHFWLRLCKASQYLPDPDQQLFDQLDEIIKILNTIIGTCIRRYGKM